MINNVDGKVSVAFINGLIKLPTIVCTLIPNHIVIVETPKIIITVGVNDSKDLATAGGTAINIPAEPRFSAGIT